MPYSRPTTPLPRRTIAAGALITVLATILCFWLSAEQGLAELQETSRQRLTNYAANLEREGQKYAFLPATLGLEPDVLTLIAHDTPQMRQTVDTYLQHLNALAGTLAVYVANRQGDVIASSNWNQPDSYVGDQLAFRPYIDDALRGRPGRFFGIGFTRGEPGYYLSAPLMIDGAPGGVAVVKVSLEFLEQSWAGIEVPVLVSDEYGVVILSSTPAWKFTALHPVDDTTRAGLERSRRYNARPLPPLGMSIERKLTPSAALVRLDNPPRNFLAQDLALPDTKWTMTVFSPVDALWAMVWTRTALVAAAFALVGIMATSIRLVQMRLQDRLRNREALQRAHDALEQKVEERTRTLKAAQDELVHAGKLAVIGQLSAGLAHELNQPLAALSTLSGNARRFIERGELASATENLEIIGRLVTAMGQLTSQLKSFARKSPARPLPVAVRAALDGAMLLLDRKLHHVQARISIDMPEKGVLVLCDMNRLEQVLVNLIGNALDALEGAPSPQISISARPLGTQIRIAVHDTGPGLSPDVQAKLFEPFFTTKEPGLGLGLAISAGIIRDFGGSLTGANHPEGGAVFSFDLPAAQMESPHA